MSSFKWVILIAVLILIFITITGQNTCYNNYWTGECMEQCGEAWGSEHFNREVCSQACIDSKGNFGVWPIED